MKRKISTIKLVEYATQELDKFEAWIDKNDYEEARQFAKVALGFIDGMKMTINAMVCTDNNDFTGDFGEWINEREQTIRRKMEIKKLSDEAENTKEEIKKGSASFNEAREKMGLPPINEGRNKVTTTQLDNKQ